MKIGFIVFSLTHLRYLIPVAQRIPSGHDIVFYLNRVSTKYNGLHIEANHKRCLDIIAREVPTAGVLYDLDALDLSFQVEIDDVPNSRHRYAIQHGVDYAAWPKKIQDTVDAYIMSPYASNRDNLLKMGVTRLSMPPLPVCMWNSGLMPSIDGRRVTVLYPDAGDNELASEIISFLDGAGYDVIVKQRRKNQPIPSDVKGTHIYDDIWYPAEAIFHPLSSDFTVGFGSTAFVDLAIAGLNYVNVDVNPGGYLLWAVPHPTLENYMRVTDRNLVLSTVKEATEKFTRVSIVADEKLLCDYVIQLINEVCDGDGQKG